jgi:hypothetical protein
MGKQVAEDRTPPIYLGPKQLAELENLQIIDKGRRSARVYLAGSIEPIMINAIGENLLRQVYWKRNYIREFLTKTGKLEAISGQAQRTGRAHNDINSESQ